MTTLLQVDEIESAQMHGNYHPVDHIILEIKSNMHYLIMQILRAILHNETVEIMDLIMSRK